MAEAKALRILHNNLDYRRLTPLCQAYVDPTASFAAPRTHYWRFTHHIHLDECITRGPRQRRPRNSHRPYGTQLQQSYANNERQHCKTTDDVTMTTATAETMTTATVAPTTTTHQTHETTTPTTETLSAHLITTPTTDPTTIDHATNASPITTQTPQITTLLAINNPSGTNTSRNYSHRQTQQ